MTHKHDEQIPAALEAVVQRLGDLEVVIGPHAGPVVAAVRSLLITAMAARDRGDLPAAVARIGEAMDQLSALADRLDPAEATLMRALAQNFRAALLRGDAAQAKQSATVMLEKSGGGPAQEGLAGCAYMRTLATVCVGLLICAGVVRADDEAFSGYGPIPVRNFQPIQLIFLNLPFERARVQAAGHFELHLESAESNEIATNQGGIDATLKFETNRTVLGGTFGVGHGVEVGLDLPVISRFGGFLDPFIDGVEHLLGNFNPERDLFPDNAFGGFHVQRGTVTLFDGKDQSFNLGDMWLSGKYEAWHAAGWPLLALRAAIKLPTGRAGGVYGSGKPDFGVGLAAEHQLLSWLMTYGNLALIYPVGPITDAHLSLNPMVTQGISFEARLFRSVSALIQQELYTSPMHGNGTGLLDGTVVELSGGFDVDVQPFLFQLGIVDNVSGVITAADFTVMLRMTYRR